MAEKSTTRVIGNGVRWLEKCKRFMTYRYGPIRIITIEDDKCVKIVEKVSK